MSFLKIFSPAKINLSLDILRRDPSGFHEIQTVYHEVPELFDEIELRETPRLITVQCDHADIPTDHRNTAYKAAKIMQEHFKVDRGAEIIIHKKIPVFSGLGGGSSNAAAVMKGLNELWDLRVPLGELIKLSHQISMDAAFFFIGGTALGTHFGERIVPLPSALKVEIIDTGVKVSSRDAYGWVDLSKCGKNVVKTEELIQGLKKQDPEKISKNLHNDFEPFVLLRFPELQKFHNENSPLHLSGSGGALFRMLAFHQAPS